MVQIFANPPEKPMPSIVQTLHLRGAKNPEKVDAVGLQPTASIPFLQYGGPEGIRTLDLSDANRTRSQLRYRPMCAVQLFYYTRFFALVKTKITPSFRKKEKLHGNFIDFSCLLW